MFTEHIHVSAAPDFAIKIGQVVHTHTIAICMMHKESQCKEELFSHRSQIELVKHLQQRLVAEGVRSNTTVKWSQSHNLSAKIVHAGVDVNFEYRLPSQLTAAMKKRISKEFIRIMDLFVKS
jgi:hypothetical protein